MGLATTAHSRPDRILPSLKRRSRNYFQLGTFEQRSARASSDGAKIFEFEKEADDPFGLDAFLHKAKQASSSKRKDDDGRDRRDDR